MIDSRPIWWRSPPPLVEQPPDPPLWRDAPRLMLVLAALGLVIGSLMPWAEGVVGGGRPEGYRASQTGEGVIMIAGGMLLAVLARTRLMWQTSSRGVQLLPFLVALVSAAMWLGAEHYAQMSIAQWRSMGGNGELGNARYVAGGAILLVLAALAWLEIRRPLAVRAQTQSLWAEWGLTRWSIATIVAALAFGALGVAAGVLAGALLPGSQFVIVTLILGIFGLFIGIGLGIILVRQVEVFYKRRGD